MAKTPEGTLKQVFQQLIHTNKTYKKIKQFILSINSYTMIFLESCVSLTIVFILAYCRTQPNSTLSILTASTYEHT